MIGDATVVGLGEATHGSHEFFAMKQRVFSHLVEEKGFTTFALEMSWTAGPRIDEYLQGGPDDARRIAKETLTGSPWEREEFVSLIAWMRRYNDRHPGRKVHFMGNDVGAPKLGNAVFDRVLSYVRTSRPQDVARLEELYAGLRPLDDVFAYLRKPVAERRLDATTAQQAFDLVTAHKGAGGDAYEWAEQHARSIAQTFAFTSLDLSDPASVSAAEHLRDRVMADNTAWWHRRTGDKMLLSAHNGHVGYLATDPVMYPTTQGAFLREALGPRLRRHRLHLRPRLVPHRDHPRQPLERGHRPRGHPRHAGVHPRPGAPPRLLPLPAHPARRRPHLAGHPPPHLRGRLVLQEGPAPHPLHHPGLRHSHPPQPGPRSHQPLTPG